MLDVSVIIVNYNTKEITKNCLYSVISATKNIDYEIIIIDNNSSDGSIELFENNENIIFLKNKKNVGFSTACNIASTIAKGKYLYFLNSDCILKNNTIKVLYDFYENNKSLNIGILGGYLKNEKGKVANSFLRFPTIYSELRYQFNILSKKIIGRNLFSNNTSNYTNIVGSSEVDVVVGASMMIDLKLFKMLYGFDENFFLYFEETDLQKRLNKEGYKNIIISGAEVIHYQGQSSIKRSYLEILGYYLESLFYYFKKHHSLLEYVVLKSIIIIISLRFIFTTRYYIYDKLVFYKKIL